MEGQAFLMRTNSIMLGTDLSRSTMFTVDAPEVTMIEWLSHVETKTKEILQAMLENSDFSVKYDLSTRDPGSPMIYVQTMQPCKYTYVMEAYPTVKSDIGGSSKQVDELAYNSLFETVIERYTKSNQKPNQVLRDTRSAEFCFRLTIKVEAVPQANSVRAHRFILLREFIILQHLWESYRFEMVANVCGLDQMIGFPMPFEFSNIVGSQLYDFCEESLNISYYNIYGKQEKYMHATIPQIIPNSSSTTICSSLSCMSTEKMGPSLSYLVELMRTQGKAFTVSSALKIYDQIICRMMVMHRYGVVHCDPNPACLFFGPGESCNVLYISEFGSSVMKPETGSLVPRFHDRFVSHLRFRERKCHFVHDMESAFYIFLYLLLGRLPWDMRMADKTKQGPVDCATTISMDVPAEIGYTDKTVTFEDKEKFWNSQDIFNRTFRMIDLEFHESLYKSFSVDLLESLYAKTKETIHAHSRINPSNYIKESNVPGSPVYNIYFGLRRIIATYFRFETLSPALKDTQGSSKLELLNRQATKDCRIAWDLSHWCWNHLDPKPNQVLAKSKAAQKL